MTKKHPPFLQYALLGLAVFMMHCTNEPGKGFDKDYIQIFNEK